MNEIAQSFEIISADALSKREIEILRSVAEGSSNKTLAERHFIAVGARSKDISTIFSESLPPLIARKPSLVRGA